MKNVVIVFNMGGPNNLSEISSFLYNIFSDRNIINLQFCLRSIIARTISFIRTPYAKRMYSKIGGKSPILKNTYEQSDVLEKLLGSNYKVFVCMRYTRPKIYDIINQVISIHPKKIIFLPLYPQFSKATTLSFYLQWLEIVRNINITTIKIINFFVMDDFIKALFDNTKNSTNSFSDIFSYRYLFTAHGLPKKNIRMGDPYQVQIELTANLLAKKLGITDYVLCYQSRIGPVEWLGPSTYNEVIRAGKDNKGIVIVPISFTSENLETLYELDIYYKSIALKSGVKNYIRVPTVGANRDFISGLAKLVMNIEMV
jgi:protoporphyrin/coproporphyrin ferrochelatase